VPEIGLRQISQWLHQCFSTFLLQRNLPKCLHCSWNPMQWSDFLYCYNRIDLLLHISSLANSVCFCGTPGNHLRNPSWKTLVYGILLFLSSSPSHIFLNAFIVSRNLCMDLLAFLSRLCLVCKITMGISLLKSRNAWCFSENNEISRKIWLKNIWADF